MSIYATWLSFGEDEHPESCGVWVEDAPGSCCFEMVGTCDCGMPKTPIVYEGSHVLPADTDRRGGWLDVAAIPDHIARDGRDDVPEGTLKDWLRLSMGNPPSHELYRGKPYISGGDAALVLTRSQVEQLRDTLTTWLEADERG